MTDTSKYAIYSRKSKFTGKGESIGNQVEICRNELKRRYDAADEDIVVFEDEGFSGANTKRPKFQEMMKRCHSNEFRIVICYRLDRISRNTSDFVRTYEELKDLGVSFRSVSDNIDDTSPMGKAMMMISSVFAQLERDIIAERIVDNMQELAKMGRWLGGNPPTGYRSIDTVGSISVDGKERKAKMLEQIPEEVEIVRLIFSKFIELESLTRTETWLLNENIRTKTGKDFSRFAIKNILKNPVYAINDRDAYLYFTDSGMKVFAEESDFDGKQGVMTYNKTLQKTGKSNKTRSFSDWIVAVGKHTGIISGRDWVRVQRLLRNNSDKSFRKPKSNDALLSGVLFCADCGNFMRPKLSTRCNKRGERVYDYLCELKEHSKGGRCNMKRINGNELDRAVCEELKKLGSDSSSLMKLLRSSGKKISEAYSDYQAEIDKLIKQKKKLKTECDNLVKVLAVSGDSNASEDIIRQINALHDQSAYADERITEYRRLMSQGSENEESLSTLSEMLSDFARSIDKLNIIRKRDLIRTLVRRIEWDGENVHLFLVGSDNDKDDPRPLYPQRDNHKRDPHALPLT